LLSCCDGEAELRITFEQRGELSAAIELRRLFPGVTDTAQARDCARTIAGWKSLYRCARAAIALEEAPWKPVEAACH
jgi:hypothetical protein